MSKAVRHGILVAGMLLAGPAFAQAEETPVSTIPVEPLAAEPAPAPIEEPATPTQLDEVVVTATKREANPRDLPASISAIRGEDLEKYGYQSQEDFLKLVPGVTFANDNINANRITIRGIGADLNTSNTTGVFIGDVPFEDPTLPRVTLDPNPFDLARIEVLKGPQGTLFGGSALNGAVRYVPQDPLIGEWEAKAFFQWDDVSQGSAAPVYGAAINIPAGETLAFRLMGFDRQAPGWIDDHTRDLEDVNQVDQQGGRFMALWEPGESWKVTAMAVIQETHVADSAITDNRDGELNRSNTPQPSPLATRYDLETLGIQYSFDAFDVLSQTSRTHKTFGGSIDSSRIGNLGDNPPPTVTITSDNESESVMQELRLTSNAGLDGGWKWLLGGFWREVDMHETTDILASDLALPIPAPLLSALAGLIPGFGGVITEEGKINTARGHADPVIVTETALFGELTMTFWDSLEATLGLRAYRTVSDSRVEFSGVLVTDPREPSLTLQKVSEGTLEEQGVNPKIALKYTLNENVALYAAAARGFRFGGPQVLVGTLTSESPPFYKSDTIWSYEAGLRTQWLGRTLIADITPFQSDWTDPQLQQADSTGLGAYFDNVGGARSRGVEVALRYLTPLPGLALAFSGAYVDTVTTEPFTTSSGVDTQPGTRWPLAADKQTATTITWQRPWFSGWEGGATLLYTTISSAPNTLAYLDQVFGYETLDATLNFANPNYAGAPELSVSLVNALDERGIISGVNNPQFAHDHVYIRPRTLVARIAFNF